MAGYSATPPLRKLGIELGRPRLAAGWAVLHPLTENAVRDHALTHGRGT